MYESEMKRLREYNLEPEQIHTYREFAEIFDQFAENRRRFLLIIGAPGSGKSHRFSHDPRARSWAYIKGTVSAIGLYCSAYDAAKTDEENELEENRPNIIDDADSLFRIPEAVSILKALTESERRKLVSWKKAATQLEERERSFWTSSPVAILCNRMPKINADTAAIFDRAKAIIFEPSAQEVHAYVGTYWREKNPRHADIYDYIGANLDKILRPSARLYEQAVEEKEAGAKWQEFLIRRWHGADKDQHVTAIAAAIWNDPKLKKGKPMIIAWQRQTLRQFGKAMSKQYFHQVIAERYLRPQGLEAEIGRWAVTKK